MNKDQIDDDPLLAAIDDSISDSNYRPTKIMNQTHTGGFRQFAQDLMHKKDYLNGLEV